MSNCELPILCAPKWLRQINRTLFEPLAHIDLRISDDDVEKYLPQSCSNLRIQSNMVGIQKIMRVNVKFRQQMHRNTKRLFTG